MQKIAIVGIYPFYPFLMVLHRLGLVVLWSAATGEDMYVIEQMLRGSPDLIVIAPWVGQNSVDVVMSRVPRGKKVKVLRGLPLEGITAEMVYKWVEEKILSQAAQQTKEN